MVRGSDQVKTWWRPGKEWGGSGLVPCARFSSGGAREGSSQGGAAVGPGEDLVETWWRPGSVPGAELLSWGS
eukprot:5983771-Pyramimonas_sp.AAC.1